jgi:hypothetical protein
VSESGPQDRPATPAKRSKWWRAAEADSAGGWVWGIGRATTESRRPPTAGPYRSRGRFTFGPRKEPQERPPEAVPNQQE